MQPPQATPNSHQIMAQGIRTWRERVAQTLWFEAVGLVLVSPLFAWASGSGGGESLVLLATLSLIVMAWAALYNTLFDLAERRRTGRVASDRPHGLRTVHAIGLEGSALLLTWPVIVVMTNLSWTAALLADLGLTATYVVYGYAFHWVYDRLRPVAACSSLEPATPAHATRHPPKARRSPPHWRA